MLESTACTVPNLNEPDGWQEIAAVTDCALHGALMRDWKIRLQGISAPTRRMLTFRRLRNTARRKVFFHL